MITRILGKCIERHYSVDTALEDIVDNNGNTVSVYRGKPRMVENVKEVGWKEICSYEGKPKYNRHSALMLFSPCDDMDVNISESETVHISSQIFRADLQEFHLKSDKVLSEVCRNKTESESLLNTHLRLFNHSMVTSNDELKAYCDEHSFVYEEVDALELFTTLFPGHSYKIHNGKLIKGDPTLVAYTSQLSHDQYALLNSNTDIAQAPANINTIANVVNTSTEREIIDE